MIVIPTGIFVMGSPVDEVDRHTDEGPQHTVNVPSFAAGRSEITRGQWAAFAAATNRPTPPPDCNGYYGQGLSWQNPGFAQTDSHPVTCVSWNDAHAYVSWLSGVTGRTYRLLTEAEWEYAARAGTTTTYSTGVLISTSQANFHSNAGTQPVGSYATNGFGLLDVHGNVWELVQDCYSSYSLTHPTDGSAYQSTQCSNHVVRGGGWFFPRRDVRSAHRGFRSRTDRTYDVGFRVARNL
jgi:formylglycine-generating enzyme required for sulfatase activity